MNWGKFRTALGLITVPLQLLWAAFLFFPPNDMRSGFVFPVMVVLLGGCLILFVPMFWFGLRHGERLQEMLREAGVAHLNPIPTSGAFWWAVTATSFLGTFTFMYWGLSIRDAGAFSEQLSRVDSAYFAVATFTTTGFGDIVALSEAARLAVTAQMVAGFALVAVGLTLALSRLRA